MLNEFGFVRRTYSEILESMENKAKEMFGENVRTGPTSVLGILLRIWAWPLSLVHELLEKVYYSSFVNSADGVSLDRLAGNNGLYRNPATAAMVDLSFTGEPGYIIEEGVQFATEKMVAFFMIESVQLDDEGNGTGQAVSVEYTSSANVPAETIVVPVEPVEEIETVINLNAATGGSDLENDTDFRKRIKLSTRANPGPPLNGIYTALYGIGSVRTVNIIENKTMQIDSFGNPPKSLHVYVSGGDAVEVADVIFNHVAAGIETVGTQEVTVHDIAGFPHVVHFDFADNLPIFAEINLTVTSRFENDGVNDVIDLVVEHINNIEMGTVVRYSYLYPIIYQVVGVSVAEIKIGTSASNVSATDIVLEPRQIAQILKQNVVVTANEV